MSRSNRVEALAECSTLVGEALELVREGFAGDSREIREDFPFVDHLVLAAELLIEYGFDEEVVAAGLLHDVLEYEVLDLDELQRRFGMKVALLVCAVTEDAEIDDFDERRQEVRERVRATGLEARRVFAAEKIANVIETRDAYVLEQEDLDEHLPLSLDEQILVWEYDMEMLLRAEEDEMSKRLPEELLGLWDQRCADSRAD